MTNWMLMLLAITATHPALAPVRRGARRSGAWTDT